MIQSVVSLNTESKFDLLLDAECARDLCVDVEIAGTTETVGRDVAPVGLDGTVYA